MGGIWLRTREFGATLSEGAGYKAGLALDEARLRALIDEGGYRELWPEADSLMRIRSEEYEEIFAYVLYRLGIGSSLFEPGLLVGIWHRSKDDPQKRELFEPVAQMFLAFLKGLNESASGSVVNPGPFIDEVAAQHGRAGARLALEMIESTANSLAVSPWTPVRSVEWKDVRDLDELFASEKLESPHGEYFDQRFANFLAANFEQVDTIHWRQFEGLAAEFFKREGFLVELGPGRGDGGVDIRLWPDKSDGNSPAAVLVQCKRQKAKVPATVVKALWADTDAERAGSGLIVTTSSFAPSAEALRTTRGYPVTAVDRPRLREWVQQMRTPGSGFFLGQ
jgi:restriction system protein